MVPRAYPSPQFKRRLDRFNRFGIAHDSVVAHENVNNGFNGKTSKVGAKMNANLDKKHAVCDK